MLQHTHFGTFDFTEFACGIAETVSGDDGVGIYEEDDGSDSTGSSVCGPGAVWSWRGVLDCVGSVLR